MAAPVDTVAHLEKMARCVRTHPVGTGDAEVVRAEDDVVEQLTNAKSGSRPVVEEFALHFALNAYARQSMASARLGRTRGGHDLLRVGPHRTR